MKLSWMCFQLRGAQSITLSYTASTLSLMYRNNTAASSAPFVDPLPLHNGPFDFTVKQNPELMTDDGYPEFWSSNIDLTRSLTNSYSADAFTGIDIDPSTGGLNSFNDFTGFLYPLQISPQETVSASPSEYTTELCTSIETSEKSCEIEEPNERNSTKNADEAVTSTGVKKVRRRRYRKKKPPLSEAEHYIKRERFLERNRAAARKCRNKKEDEASCLLKKTLALEKENTRLKIIQSSLLEKLRQYKAMSAYKSGKHTHAGDWIDCDAATFCLSPTPESLISDILEDESIIQNVGCGMGSKNASL